MKFKLKQDLTLTLKSGSVFDSNDILNDVTHPFIAENIEEINEQPVKNQETKKTSKSKK